MQIDGTLSITGGTVVGRAGNLDTARYNQTFAADQWVEADLTNQVLNTGVCGPMLRVTPGGDFYYFWIQTGTPVGIFRRVSNAYTQVGGNGAPVPTGPFKCRMEAQGTTLRMYVDGVLWLTVTDPGGIATGQPGILGNGPGVLDNFRAGDLPYTPAVVPTSDTFTYANGVQAGDGRSDQLEEHQCLRRGDSGEQLGQVADHRQR